MPETMGDILSFKPPSTFITLAGKLLDPVEWIKEKTSYIRNRVLLALEDKAVSLWLPSLVPAAPGFSGSAYVCHTVWEGRWQVRKRPQELAQWTPDRETHTLE